MAEVFFNSNASTVHKFYTKETKGHKALYMNHSFLLYFYWLGLFAATKRFLLKVSFDPKFPYSVENRPQPTSLIYQVLVKKAAFECCIVCMLYFWLFPHPYVVKKTLDSSESTNCALVPHLKGTGVSNEQSLFLYVIVHPDKSSASQLTDFWMKRQSM